MNKRVWLVQLPFPSFADPHKDVARYYTLYAKRYQEVIPEYFIPEGTLWELPLWVAHLAGALRSLGIECQYGNLCAEPAEEEPCVERLLRDTSEDDVLMFSPLAQNFHLARAVSRCLSRARRLTVMGGNMATLAEPGDASHIHRGQADPQALLSIILADQLGESERPVTLGRQSTKVNYAPDYSIFRTEPPRVPLLRLNASHGCQFACEFCGDAWSRQLKLVSERALEAELKQLGMLFPETKLLYLGDKTFGQARESVESLCRLLESRPQYRMIVQTHWVMITPELIAQMKRLRVAVVELGFETADEQLLRASNKPACSPEQFAEKLSMLRDAGIRVVLNLLGSLPRERPASHDLTLDFLQKYHELVFLYNLYNFVPYPLTPIFPELRSRIFNWNFADWREDAAPVYHPFHQSAEQAWQLFLEKTAAAEQYVSQAAAEVQPSRESDKRVSSVVVSRASKAREALTLRMGQQSTSRRTLRKHQRSVAADAGRTPMALTAGMQVSNGEVMGPHGLIRTRTISRLLPGDGRVILSAPFGRTMDEMFVPAYFLACNGLEVVLYDPTHHTGDSHGEIYNYRLSRHADDMRVVVDHFGDSETILVGISLASRVILRVLAGINVGGAVMLVPTVHTTATLQAVTGVDYRAIMEKNRDALERELVVLGHTISTAMVVDAHERGISTLDHARADVVDVKIPVRLVAGGVDEWVELDDVKALVDEMRSATLEIVPNGGHEFHRSPVLAQRYCESVQAHVLDIMGATTAPRVPQWREIISAREDMPLWDN